MPPLGLATVAGMFPEGYNLRLVDMNTRGLSWWDLRWADVVFTSTMIVQQASLLKVAGRCNRHGVPIVAGGPHPTSYDKQIDAAAKKLGVWIDHYIRGEVEDTFEGILEALQADDLDHVTKAPERPAITGAPVPRFDLLLRRFLFWTFFPYESMAVQCSRGCPFNCEFCDITKLFGKVPRFKAWSQLLKELDLLYELGWRGSVFLVDDNFIGNKKDVTAILTELVTWQNERGHPFKFFTEASVNLARMDSLLDQMVAAGFVMVFLGIEHPDPDVLTKMDKGQNVKAGNPDYLADCVRTIQAKGIEVTAGFIYGADGEKPGSAEAIVDFVMQTGTVVAMTGLLSALQNTDLYHRLEAAGRLRGDSDGDNVGFGVMNFVPERPEDEIYQGYEYILTTLYDATLKNFFARCTTLFENLGNQPTNRGMKIGIARIHAFVMSLIVIGCSRQGPEYFRFLRRTLRDHPSQFPEAVRYAIIGHHFQRVTAQQIRAYHFRLFQQRQLARLVELQSSGQTRLEDIRRDGHEAIRAVQARYRQVPRDVRATVTSVRDAFVDSVERIRSGQSEAA